MKTATILPQAFLHLAMEDGYHMALGHLIGAEGFEQYTKFFTEAGKDPEQFVMLDTGLIEGNARPVDELVDKAIMIHADEMALNDVFTNHMETLRESHDALNYIESYGLGIRTMGIPQGEDIDDWVECAKEMLTWPIDTIGIPKVLSSYGGMRGRIAALHEIQPYLGDKEVHLLGCWDSPLELKMVQNAVRFDKLRPVRGVDSAIAYAYARKGIRITDDERPEGAIDFGATECDMDILEYNIAVWREEAKPLRSITDVKFDKTIQLF